MGLISRGVSNNETLPRAPDGDPSKLTSYVRTESYVSGEGKSPSPRFVEEGGQYFSLGGVPSPRSSGSLAGFIGADDLFLNGQLMSSARPMHLPPLPHAGVLGKQEYENMEASSLFSYGTLGAVGDTGARSRSLEDVLGRHTDAETRRSPKVPGTSPSPRFAAPEKEGGEEDEEEIQLRSEDEGNDAEDEDTSLEEELAFINDYVYGFYDEVGLSYHPWDQGDSLGGGRASHLSCLSAADLQPTSMVCSVVTSLFITRFPSPHALCAFAPSHWPCFSITQSLFTCRHASIIPPPSIPPLPAASSSFIWPPNSVLPLICRSHVVSLTQTTSHLVCLDSDKLF